MVRCESIQGITGMKMTPSVKVESNWTQIAGCNFTNALVIRNVSDDDVFVKPNLDDILGESNAVLFCRPENCTDAFEVQLQIFPKYKIAGVSLVSSAPKLELFIGCHKEYIETMYGVIVEEGESEGAGSEIEIPSSFRYDIEIERSGVVELSLKLVTGNSFEICIFGFMVHIAPNPNGITTMLPKVVNVENVQGMLTGSKQKLSANAEKCKQFMETFTQSGGGVGASASSTYSNDFLEIANAMSKHNATLMDKQSALIAHIDLRFEQLEHKILARLDAFEAQQSLKLDKIIKILGT